MKDRLMKNIGLKILSLLIAMVIWVLIVNVDDPVTTRKFENVIVQDMNGEAITKKDKVYTVTGGKKVDITVTGRRSFVNKLSQSDFFAFADLSKLSITGAAYIEVECKKYTRTNYTLTLGSTKMMTVELEDKISQKYPVDIQLSGEIDGGYTIVDKSASPNMITVSGAASVIGKIKNVMLDVNVQGRTSSFQKVVPKSSFIVKDNNGDTIDNEKLEFSVDEITVSTTLQRTKDVKLNIKAIGSPRNGYKLKDFDYEPKTITVTGDEDALNAVSAIPFEYDITDRYEDYEENLAISEELQDVIKSYGVSLVDETQNIAISIKFEKLETKEVKVDSDLIEARNLPDGYKVEINTSTINALVQGSADLVHSLSAADLKPYIDLSGYSAGTKLVNVKFAEDEGYDILNKPTINITITELGSMGSDMNGE